MKQADTHLALARAAFELHSTIGPSRATVSAIAEKAGVQRLTVYRHFPDVEAIFAACSAYSFAEDPPPDPEAWRSIAEPEKRLRSALLQLYSYYRRRRQLLTNLHRDAEMPAVAAALARRRQVLAKGAVVLAEGWVGADAKTTRFLVASIGHALHFTTWQSLAETERLTEKEVVQVMIALVQGVTRK